jgi:hypothetical protein
MTLDVSTGVIFKCSHCELRYLALREQSKQHSGRIDCVDCGKIAFEWTDFYTLADPHPIRMNEPSLVRRR